MIELMNGFVNIKNRFDNKNIEFLIKHPKEITNGNWGCKIAVFKNEDLWYYNSKIYAHQINEPDIFEIINFSIDMKLFYMYEFKPFSVKRLSVFDINEDCYYIKEIENSNSLSWIKQLFLTYTDSKKIIKDCLDQNFEVKQLRKDFFINIPLFYPWYGKDE